MSNYPNLNNELQLIKIKTRGDDIKKLKIKRKNTIMKKF